MKTKIPAFIIHVKGAIARRERMETLIEKYSQFDWQFIEKGNISDLSATVLQKYFIGKMAKKSPFVSCAYKHLLAWQAISESAQTHHLIIEDDIKFYKNFNTMISNIVIEIEQNNYCNYLISLEDSLPRYVPRSERKFNTFLYRRSEVRFLGAYLISRETAILLSKEAETVKIGTTVDWFLSNCLKNKLINGFWCQPAVACQASLSGEMPSLIDNKKSGGFRFFNFTIQRNIKKLRAFLK